MEHQDVYQFLIDTLPWTFLDSSNSRNDKNTSRQSTGNPNIDRIQPEQSREFCNADERNSDSPTIPRYSGQRECRTYLHCGSAVYDKANFMLNETYLSTQGSWVYAWRPCDACRQGIPILGLTAYRWTCNKE